MRRLNALDRRSHSCGDGAPWASLAPADGVQIANHPHAVDSRTAALGPDLDRWYCHQPSIRRLLAVDDSPTLRVLVTLEPTADGGDSFPIWLAMQSAWTSELRALAGCPVQLMLVAPDAIDDTCEAASNHFVAHLCWRDPCAISSQSLTEDFTMRCSRPLALCLAIAGSSFFTLTSSAADDPVVEPLVTKSLPELPGKEVVMLMVEYPPGGADPVHRHAAHGFIYVLEGSIVMQVKGGKEVTLKPGETFYESPSDLHVVGRNVSNTEPARFLVFLVKDRGTPVLTLE